MKPALLLTLIISLSACSLVGERVAGRIADGVRAYCAVERQDARELYRRVINEDLAKDGHMIAVYCKDDAVFTTRGGGPAPSIPTPPSR